MKVIKEKSCGIVVFHRKDDEYEFLLLHYPEGHWDLPKGHVEEGESEHETALRELEEETGINDIKIMDGFREEIHYFFTTDKGTISKNVYFFMGEASDKDIEISHEHQDFIWLPYEKALEKITFKNAKDVLIKAFKLIRK